MGFLKLFLGDLFITNLSFIIILDFDCKLNILEISFCKLGLTFYLLVFSLLSNFLFIGN